MQIPKIYNGTTARSSTASSISDDPKRRATQIEYDGPMTSSAAKWWRGTIATLALVGSGRGAFGAAPAPANAMSASGQSESPTPWCWDAHVSDVWASELTWQNNSGRTWLLTSAEDEPVNGKLSAGSVRSIGLGDVAQPRLWGGLSLTPHSLRQRVCWATTTYNPCGLTLDVQDLFKVEISDGSGDEPSLTLNGKAYKKGDPSFYWENFENKIGRSITVDTSKGGVVDIDIGYFVSPKTEISASSLPISALASRKQFVTHSQLDLGDKMGQFLAKSDEPQTGSGPVRVILQHNTDKISVRLEQAEQNCSLCLT